MEINNNEEGILFTVILAIVVIILVCYFSKSSAVKVLLYSSLGRALLVLIIIFVTSYNLMNGLLAVLIIILLSLSIGTDQFYMEGFKQINILEETKKKKDLTNDPNHNWFYSPSLKSLEGRDQVGMEDNIRGGKSSNSIPVLPHKMLESDDVLPNEPRTNVFESLTSVF
jgi:hypothetical protein